MFECVIRVLCICVVAEQQETITPVPLASGGASTPEAPPRKYTEMRLSGALVPWHYNVELQPFIYAPNPVNFKFRGNVSILFSVRAAEQRNITLHSHVNISLESIVVRCVSCARGSDAARATLHATALSIELVAQMATIVLNDTLLAHENYSLWAHYSGPLLRDMHGLYWSSYKTTGANGSETQCAITPCTGHVNKQLRSCH